MKEQQAIVATGIYDFQNQMNKAFREGWRIVPGTVTSFGIPEWEHTTYKERYFAVVEREK